MKHEVVLRALVIASTFAASVARGEPAPDVILVNGRVITMSVARPRAEALAIREGRIVRVGTTDEVEKLAGPATKAIDLQGNCAIPGFIEGHGHFTALGRAQLELDLSTAKSWEEICNQVGEAAKQRKPGEWILGGGWHQEKWTSPPAGAVEGFPTHDGLTRAAPANPVWLSHSSGHAYVGNAAAMKLAGVTRETKDPRGGRVLRTPAGEPSGVFLENAAGLVDAAQSSVSPEENRASTLKDIELAGRQCLENGITTFHDAGVDSTTIEIFRELARAGKLPVRLWVMVMAGNGEDTKEFGKLLTRSRTVGEGGGFLSVRGVKAILDGALGSHGAWLLEPYKDLTGSTGLNTMPIPHLEEIARVALANDYQMAVHAIGDRANREVLDLYERVLKKAPADRRWRIEHAQHLHPADVPRFAGLGVIASMQGCHCTSDGPWVPDRIGPERARTGAYVWHDLLASGATVINGTDTPVEDVDPIRNFHSSVTRKLANGKVFFGEQRMTRLEALRAATLSAAWAGFEEKDKGSLEEGKLADIAVLSQDLLEVPDDKILETKVLKTLVGGVVRYEE